MSDILTQFSPAVAANDYTFGEVISVSGAALTVKTTSGLQITINDSAQTYDVGDQLVLAAQNGNLSSTFVIRKIDKAYPAATNLVISSGEG